MQDRPLIGVPACIKDVTGHPFHAANQKYLVAIIESAGGLPMLIPALGDVLGLEDLVDRLDGLLLTGSPSDVSPSLYGGSDGYPDQKQDAQRDATTLPLIRAATAAGLPLFAICRGIQEMNVAFGGTLHQAVHTMPGMLDHRSPRDATIDVKYATLSHTLRLTPGGLLARLLQAEEVKVNSLHWQGIARLGRGLVAEGTAPDGLVEAIRVADAPGFTLGVQWHPEYKAGENAISRALFSAFGDAAKARAAGRRRLAGAA